MKKIYIGCDHAGFELKEKIKEFLTKKNLSFEDLGNTEYDEKDDYPDYAFPVAKRVAKENAIGILFCGSGLGMCIAANRIKGVRAVAINNLKDSESSRNEDYANILCLGGRTLGFWKAKRILNKWLETPYSKEARHKRRVKKIR